MRYKFIIFLLMTIIFFFVACSNIDKKKELKIVNFLKTSKVDSSLFKKSNILSTNSRSLDAEHYAFSFFEGNYITTFLNQNCDSIIIYDGNRLHKIKIPFNFKLPVSSLYFHNYDSIFVFIDREFVYKFSNDSLHFDDFILINSRGKLIDKYSLDSVKYIYKGKLNPMVYLKKSFVENTRIYKDKFYLPFSIYNPSISEDILKQQNIKMLCEYDLNEHSLRMLDIQIPNSDIGKSFPSDVLANSLDFFLLNDSILLYTFDYSSSIYQYNLNTDSSFLKVKFNNFLFNNDTINYKDSYSASFYCPYFDKVNNMYIRRIKVQNYKNFEDFEITQLFDTSFNILGNCFSDSANSAISINAKGELIVSDKKNNYLSNEVDLRTYSIKSIDDIELSLEKKEVHLINYNKNRDSSELTYNERLLEYINALKLLDTRKVVVINTDVMCSHCIDFLMKKLKDNYELYNIQHIKYIFYGNNIRFAEDVMRDYQISNFELIYIDVKNKYLNYLKEEEYYKDPLIILTKSPKVYLYKPNNIGQVFSEFISY